MRVKSFDLYNHKVTIKYSKKIKGKDRGECDPNTMRLKVVTTSPIDSVDLPDSAIEHNRLHEQVHLWMDALGRNDLYNNEKFVDGLAGLIAQYEATKK